MSSLALMRFLEGTPERYDAGMAAITLGRIQAVYDAVAEAAVTGPGERVRGSAYQRHHDGRTPVALEPIEPIPARRQRS